VARLVAGRVERPAARETADPTGLRMMLPGKIWRVVAAPVPAVVIGRRYCEFSKVSVALGGRRHRVDRTGAGANSGTVETSEKEGLVFRMGSAENAAN